MSTSVVDIWNLALANLGNSQEIEDPNEKTKNAKIMNRFYPHCRDYVLKDAYWGFATKALQLASITDQEFPGWTYLYGYPSDCLFMRAITDDGGARLMQNNVFTTLNDLQLIPNRVPFKLIARENLESVVIVTDLAEAWGIYTAQITVPALWGPIFTECLSYRLAAKAGPALNVDPELVQTMYKLYLIERGKAMEADLNEQQPDQEADSPSVMIRG